MKDRIPPSLNLNTSNTICWKMLQPSNPSWQLPGNDGRCWWGPILPWCPPTEKVSLSCCKVFSSCPVICYLSSLPECSFSSIKLPSQSMILHFCLYFLCVFVFVFVFLVCICILCVYLYLLCVFVLPACSFSSIALPSLIRCTMGNLRICCTWAADFKIWIYLNISLLYLIIDNHWIILGVFQQLIVACSFIEYTFHRSYMMGTQSLGCTQIAPCSKFTILSFI